MGSKKTVIFAGVPVQVVRRPRMKNIRIRVVPPKGEIVLSCPYGVAAHQWQEVLQEAWAGVIQSRERCRQKHSAERLLPVGGCCRLWGRIFPLELVRRPGKPYIRHGTDKIFLAVQEEPSEEYIRSCLHELYRHELMLMLPEVLAECENMTGLRANEVRLKKMHTRWGSCNVSAKRIWLSLSLAGKPVECLKYVIIHELVHLLERKHNARFHALVRGFYPRWQEAEAQLCSDS